MLSMQGHTFDPRTSQISCFSVSEQDFQAVQQEENKNAPKPVTKPFQPVSQRLIMQSVLCDSEVVIV